MNKLFKVIFSVSSLSFCTVPLSTITSCSKVKSLKIMSFNIQHGVDYKHKKETGETIVNLDPVVEVIKEHNPDIIGIQEIYNSPKTVDTDYGCQLDYIADQLNYYSYFSKSASIGASQQAYGVGLLSKFPIVDSSNIIIPHPEHTEQGFETRSVAKIKIKLSDNSSFYAFCSHYGLQNDEFEHAVDTTLDFTSNANRYVFMGDLNMTPDNAQIQRLYQAMNPTIADDALSFPSIDPTKHIDYIFTSKNLQHKNGTVWEDVYSDHRPVGCTVLL